jgi:hypothetical protein
MAREYPGVEDAGRALAPRVFADILGLAAVVLAGDEDLDLGNVSDR